MITRTINRRVQAVLWIALAAVLLVGFYIALKDVGDGVDTSTRASSPVFALSIGPPQPGKSFPVFKALQGDRVTFKIRTDRVGQVNVHGYEQQIPVSPGTEATLTFIVRQPGSFPLHLHELTDPTVPNGEVMHRHLAILEVQPR